MIGGIDIPGDFLGWLLRTSLQASVLIGLVLGTQWLLEHRLAPRWRFALWWLVVLRLMMPVAIESPLSLFNLVPAQSVSFTSSAIETRPMAPGDSRVSEAVETEESTVPLQKRADSQQARPSQNPTEPSALSWKTIAFVVWLVGAGLLGVILIGLAWIERRRIRLLPQLTDERIVDLLTECRERMGIKREIEIRQTYDASSPALCGVIGPVLLLPKHLGSRLRSEQLRHVFLHELAHFKRGDISFNWLTALLLAIHWFNPFVWWAVRRMRADAEMAADALALSFVEENENQAYGETVLELMDGTRRSVPLPGLVGISINHQPIKRRIEMIARFGQIPSWSLLGIGTLLALSVLAFVIVTDGRSGDKADEIPSFQGKTAQQWLSRLGGASNAKGRQALVKMGPPAIPYVIKAYRSQPNVEQSDVADVLSQILWAERHLFDIRAQYRDEVRQGIKTLLQFLEAGNQSRIVLQAFGFAGPLAEEAEPELREIVREESRDKGRLWQIEKAAWALAGIGADIWQEVALFVEKLDSEAPEVKEHAASALGYIGPKAESAVPKLADLFCNGATQRLRSSALAALISVGSVPAESRHLLPRFLDSSENRGRFLAAEAILQFGPVDAQDKALRTITRFIKNNLHGNVVLAIPNHLKKPYPELVEVLSKVARESDLWFCRKRALSTLRQMGAKNVDQLLRQNGFR